MLAVADPVPANAGLAGVFLAVDKHLDPEGGKQGYLECGKKKVWISDAYAKDAGDVTPQYQKLTVSSLIRQRGE